MEGVSSHKDMKRSLINWRGPWLLVVCLVTAGLPLSVVVVQAQSLDCVIEPNAVVDVGSDVEGVLDKVLVDQGDLVRQGQPIAQLESSLQEVAVRIATIQSENDSIIQTNQARVDFGTRRLVRTKELYESEISSLSELDEAETSKLLAELDLEEAKKAKQVAQLDLELAQAELALRTIVSPISGVVTERFHSVGELVSRTPIMKLAQIDPLRVEVFVPVSLVGKVQVGMVGEVQLEVPGGGAHHTATVTVVDHVADAVSGTFGIRLSLPNPDNRLQAGLKCRIQFRIP